MKQRNIRFIREDYIQPFVDYFKKTIPKPTCKWILGF